MDLIEKIIRVFHNKGAGIASEDRHSERRPSERRHSERRHSERGYSGR